MEAFKEENQSKSKNSNISIAKFMFVSKLF